MQADLIAYFHADLLDLKLHEVYKLLVPKTDILSQAQPLCLWLQLRNQTFPFLGIALSAGNHLLDQGPWTALFHNF